MRTPSIRSTSTSTSRNAPASTRPGSPYVASRASANTPFSNTRKPITWPSASRPVTHTKSPMSAMARASGMALRVGTPAATTPVMGSITT